MERGQSVAIVASGRWHGNHTASLLSDGGAQLPNRRIRKFPISTPIDIKSSQNRGIAIQFAPALSTIITLRVAWGNVWHRPLSATRSTVNKARSVLCREPKEPPAFLLLVRCCRELFLARVVAMAEERKNQEPEPEIRKAASIGRLNSAAKEAERKKSMCAPLFACYNQFTKTRVGSALSREYSFFFNFLFAHLLWWAIAFPVLLDEGYENDLEGGKEPHGSQGSGIVPIALFLVIVASGLFFYRFVRRGVCVCSMWVLFSRAGTLRGFCTARQLACCARHGVEAQADQRVCVCVAVQINNLIEGVPLTAAELITQQITRRNTTGKKTEKARATVVP